MVARHLNRSYRFVCFTDAPYALPGDIETLPMGVPNWRWNLRKMALYKPDNGLSGRVLALDLDTVIVGCIDDIADYRGPFCVVEDFYRKGRNGGGVISFETSDALTDRLYRPVAEKPMNVAARTKGAERYWYDMQMPEADHWQDLLPGQVVTFKPRPDERLHTPPHDARIVCFHGKPAIHEVADQFGWIGRNWC